MKIQFHGAVRNVTGSMHLLTVNDHRVLLDCGLYQGRRSESIKRNHNLPFEATSIDAVILSHAHIDHSGNIPNLIKSGFQGSVYATSATRDLCASMLPDSGHIQESDAAYLNRKRARKGLPPVEPLYTRREAVQSLRCFRGIEYGYAFDVAPGVQATFYDAGHILGSSIVVLDLQEGERKVRLAFSGDLGRPGLPILRDPSLINDVDVLVIESTYGSRLHETVESAKINLAETVGQTIRRGGKVIIPSFAVGRTQEIVYALHQLYHADALPQTKIYVDSPLATNVTEVFRLHPECYDEQTFDFLTATNHQDPFGFSRLTYVRDTDESKALNMMKEPAVIISPSGMCEAGRILHHLRNNIEDPRTTVLFVGFQAEHTLGRRIRDGVKKVRIFHDEFKVQAEVERIDGYSAHADRNELLDWVLSVKVRGDVKRAYVVHGDEENAFALAEGIQNFGVHHAIVPEEGKEYTL